MDANKVDTRLTAVTSALITKMVNQEIHIRLLETLLVEKGIVTVKEFQEGFNAIQDRDFEEISVEITSLLDNFEMK